MSNKWSLQVLVKDLISYTATQNPAPRAEIWASELGKPYLDTYLKMKGTPYTNPASGDGLFNFYLGKAIESGIYDMLEKCGLAHRPQEKLTITLPKCLPVVGKPDIVLEVKDWDEVLKSAKIAGDDTNEIRVAEKSELLKTLIKSWATKYPEGLPLTPFEVKSCSEWSFNEAKKKGFKEVFPHYFLQAYTYLKALKVKEVHLLFISKGSKFDSYEVVIQENEVMDIQWAYEIRTISNNFKTDIPPAPEPLLVINNWGKESVNWKLNYSSYRDHIVSTYYPESISLIK